MAFMEGTLDDAANIAAINVYMGNQTPKTPAAAKAKDEFRKWHDDLGMYDRNFPSRAVYDVARNLRNKFEAANATTPAEVAAVAAVRQTGLSSEQLRGEADRRVSSGDYLKHPELDPPPPPLIPTKYKIIAALGVVGYFAFGTLKKIYIDPLLRIAGRR